MIRGQGGLVGLAEAIRQFGREQLIPCFEERALFAGRRPLLQPC